MIARMIAVLLGGLALAGGAQAGTYTKLYSFCTQSSCSDGAEPHAGVVADTAGNLYGTTRAGGAHGAGAAFRLSPDGSGGWTYSVIYNFCARNRRGCLDGADPSAPLIADAAGNLYGTAATGGKFGDGLAFKLVPQADLWQLVAMHSFCSEAACADGAFPAGGLSYLGQRDGALYDGTSLLYGTTLNGSAFQKGVVYSLKQGPHYWQHRTLYRFCPEMGTCPVDGNSPNSGVIVHSPKLLYGATAEGGAALSGTAFSLTRVGGAWQHQVLHDFCSARRCADGQTPGALTESGAGALLGSTANGPRTPFCARSACGTSFSLVPGTGALTTLHRFCSETDCADGSAPGPLTILANGDLAGVAISGGIELFRTDFGHGVLFRLDGSANLSVLHAFCAAANCSDGSAPSGRVLVDGSGRMFGTTQGGGDTQRGVVWMYEP